MKFFKDKSVIICVIMSLLSSNFSFAAERSARDFVKFYNKSRGSFLRNHDRAKEKLKEEYQKTVLEDFQGDIRAFFLTTLGDFENYRQNRSFLKKKAVDRFVKSSSAISLAVLYDFYIEKAQRALEAMANNQEQTDDPVVNVLIHDLSENELISVKALRDALKVDDFQGQSNVGKIASGVVVGLALYWFGPAYAIEATRALFPYVWKLAVGPVPAKTSYLYWTLYLPALNNTSGYVFTHSTPILVGTWAVCAPVLHGTATGISYLIRGLGSLIQLSIQSVYNRCTPLEQAEPNNLLESEVEDEHEGYVLLTAPQP